MRPVISTSTTRTEQTGCRGDLGCLLPGPGRPSAPGRFPVKTMRKTIPNPDFYEQPQVREQMEDFCWKLDSAPWKPRPPRGAAANTPWGLQHEHMSHFPEDYGLEIPPDGAWIMVKYPPYAEITVEPLSMFRASPIEHKGANKKLPGFRRKLARVVTPDGALDLYPYEYVRVEDITVYMGENGVETHYLNEETVIEPALLHYVMSRGISKNEAMLLLLGTITDTHFVYFTVHSDVRTALGYP